MSQNLIIYLAIEPFTVNKTTRFIGGLHGYTYNVEEEGRKKLQKGVPTTLGYYVGNEKNQGSVVNIVDYLCATVINGRDSMEVSMLLLDSVFNLLNTNEEYNNVCIITDEPNTSKVLVAEDSSIKRKLVDDMELAEMIFRVKKQIKDYQTGERQVFFRHDLSVEGGLGNKLAYKHAGMAKIETKAKGVSRIVFSKVAKKEYEDPAIDFNKIVCAGRWYYDTSQEEHYKAEREGYRVYNFGRVEPDKKYYGKLTPDVTFANLYTKKPIETLDIIYDYCLKLIPNPNGYLTAGIINSVASKDLARIIHTFPGVKSGNNIVFPFVSRGQDEPLIAELIDPPMLSFQIRANIHKVNVIFDLFMGKDENLRNGPNEFIDITHLIYQDETNKKGVVKRKLHPDFKQNTSTFMVPVNHPKAVKPVPLTLSVGYDLPDRTNLNSCIDLMPKIWLVSETQNDKGVRYACVVETDEWIYIQMSAVANLRILNLKELGLNPPKK